MKSQQEAVVCATHNEKSHGNWLIDFYWSALLFCSAIGKYILFYSSLRFTRFPASFSRRVTLDVTALCERIMRSPLYFRQILLLHWMESSDNLIVAFLFVCIKLNIIDWQSLVKCISNKQKFYCMNYRSKVGKTAFRLLCFYSNVRTYVIWVDDSKHCVVYFCRKKKNEAEEQ